MNGSLSLFMAECSRLDGNSFCQRFHLNGLKLRRSQLYPSRKGAPRAHSGSAAYRAGQSVARLALDRGSTVCNRVRIFFGLVRFAASCIPKGRDTHAARTARARPPCRLRSAGEVRPRYPRVVSPLLGIKPDPREGNRIDQSGLHEPLYKCFAVSKFDDPKAFASTES
jgi:hypothetical protein